MVFYTHQVGYVSEKVNADHNEPIGNGLSVYSVSEIILDHAEQEQQCYRNTYEVYKTIPNKAQVERQGMNECIVKEPGELIENVRIDISSAERWKTGVPQHEFEDEIIKDKDYQINAYRLNEVRDMPLLIEDQEGHERKQGKGRLV